MLMSAWAPKFNFTWVMTLFALRLAACSSSVVTSFMLPVENPCVLSRCCSHCVVCWCFQLCAGCWDCPAKVHAAVCNVVLQHAQLPVGLAFANQMASDLILLRFRDVLFKLLALWVSLQPCWPLLVSKLWFSCCSVWVVLVVCLVCLGWIFCFHFFDQSLLGLLAWI